VIFLLARVRETDLIVMSKTWKNSGPSGNNTRYQRQLKGSGGSGTSQAQVVRGLGGQSGRRESSEKVQQRLDGDEIDTKFGFVRIKEGPKRIGWLLNYLPIVSSRLLYDVM
jgi:hypothetical protein